MKTETQQNIGAGSVPLSPFERAKGILERKGARALAGACLNYQAKRLCGGLSIMDLPDLPCGMDFRDYWEDEFNAGLTEENFAEALAQAADVIREIMSEEGFPAEDCE